VELARGTIAARAGRGEEDSGQCDQQQAEGHAEKTRVHGRGVQLDLARVAQRLSFSLVSAHAVDELLDRAHRQHA
jgi:hypothetical protein